MELSHSKGSRPQGSDEYISLKPLKGQQEPANVDGNSLFASSLDPSPIQISSGPNKDWNSIVLLVILYMLQGVPLGLALGSLPYLLKANSNLSYAAMGVFSFAQYPYSLKLLWSPIVDSIYFLGFGRRKTWIVPIQIVVGLIFLLGGKRIERSLDNPSTNIYGITGTFLFIVFLCATQDIAVDGWALTLLSKENLSYASTCQDVGLRIGYFMSFTVFLAINSVEFSNSYVWSEPQDHPLVSLASYLKFWGLVYLLVTSYLVLFKREGNSWYNDVDMDVKSAYKTIWQICKLPHMFRFILVLLVAKIGFVANEMVTGLKLLEKGFNKEDLALLVLIDFPFQLMFGYLAARWSRGPRPFNPWIYAFYTRLLAGVLGMLLVSMFPKDGVTATYFLAAVLSNLLNSFSSAIQFVCMSAFITRVSDPVIGGTYTTLLNTFSNFGGTWPSFFVLEAVDLLTQSECIVPDLPGFECTTEETKKQCVQAGGTCIVLQDGYYVVGALSLVMGTVIFLSFIVKQVRILERLPIKVWRLHSDVYQR